MPEPQLETEEIVIRLPLTRDEKEFMNAFRNESGMIFRRWAKRNLFEAMKRDLKKATP